MKTRRAFTLIDTFLSLAMISTAMLVVLQMAISSRQSYFGARCAAIAYRECENFTNILEKYDKNPVYHPLNLPASYSFAFLKTDSVDSGTATVEHTRTNKTISKPFYTHTFSVRVPLPGILMEDSINQTVEVYHEKF